MQALKRIDKAEDVADVVRSRRQTKRADHRSEYPGRQRLDTLSARHHAGATGDFGQIRRTACLDTFIAA